MTDAEIIAELKREPAEELRRLQRKPYEWKVEHAQKNLLDAPSGG
jgi:hypothetical protein